MQNATISPHPAQSAVFVFGSNRKGIHGAGAALHAARWCGARRGQGEGTMGASFDPSTETVRPACYAIPTKADPYTRLSLDEVAQHVEAFLHYARQCPKLTFQVTRIGCGLAGFSDEEIAPLFAGAPTNCLLPGRWLSMRDTGVARMIVAGDRCIRDRGIALTKIEALTRRISTLPGFEIVLGVEQKSGSVVAEWARQAGFTTTAFPIEPDRYGKAAASIRNQQMAWYATHLIAFWDGKHPSVCHMIEMARREKLHVRIVRVEPGL